MNWGNKEKILFALKENSPDWVSGRALSVGLGISRTAVWKWVKRLEAEGYVIESSTNRGYRLNESPERLLPAEISCGLGTTVLGRGEIHHALIVDSTNDWAKRLVQGGAAEGSLVTAEGQTGGRGRRGRFWHSPAGAGIYASLILRPKISPYDAPRIGLLAATALAETLLGLVSLPVSLKWPNDVMIGDKKVAGILTEIGADPERVEYMVVGFGLNVNTPSFPGEMAGLATSLRLEAGRDFSRTRIFQDFLSRFENYYLRLNESRVREALKRYRELSGLIGRRVMIDAIDRRLTGTVRDVDERGRLILDSGQGDRTRLSSGDVIKVY